MAKEKNFENQVKRYLKSEGIIPFGTPRDQWKGACGYYEKRFGSMFVKSGMPDLHIVIYSISIECELKAEDGTLSELQKHNLMQLTSTGNIAFELRPSSFEDFKKLITYIKQDKFKRYMGKLVKDAQKIME